MEVQETQKRRWFCINCPSFPRRLDVSVWLTTQRHLLLSTSKRELSANFMSWPRQKTCHSTHCPGTVLTVKNRYVNAKFDSCKLELLQRIPVFRKSVMFVKTWKTICWIDVNVLCVFFIGNQYNQLNVIKREKNIRTTDGIQYSVKQKESQEDSFFQGDGHQANLNIARKKTQSRKNRNAYTQCQW